MRTKAKFLKEHKSVGVSLLIEGYSDVTVTSPFLTQLCSAVRRKNLAKGGSKKSRKLVAFDDTDDAKDSQR